MAKKIGIAALILVVLGVIFMPEWTLLAYQQALKPANRNKDWAPTTAYRVARINMRFWRYGRAGGMLKKAYETWPQTSWRADAHYEIALCYERTGNTSKALEWYRSFVQRYSDHQWADQAQRRIQMIETDS